MLNDGGASLISFWTGMQACLYTNVFELSSNVHVVVEEQGGQVGLSM